MKHVHLFRNLACLLIGTVLSVASARALTFPVTKTADTADGTCDADCSLREAIIAANANAGADTITLPAGTYTLSIAGSGENASATGDLDIAAGGLTINGAGSATTIIDGGAIDRVIHILGGPVAISDVMIRNGRIAGGGGVFIESATAVVGLTRVVVTGNNGLTGGGGGIRNGGILTLVDSTVSNNSTTTAQGGGIFGGNDITITNSTISGNTAQDQGAGIFYGGSATTALTITNSTISNNIGTQEGGGLYNNPPGSTTPDTVTITATTIADNSSGASTGGGVFSLGPGNLTIRQTIIAHNTGSASGPDCQGPFISQGFNLIQNATGCTITGTTTGNITGQDPQLQPLASNGGPTQTRSLSGTSPALNSVTSGCPPPAADQRGVTRPQQTACEMGAFECQAGECAGGVAPTATPTPTTPATTATPTRTNTAMSGGPAAVVPTLSFPMLALLGIALAGAALFLMKRP